MRVLVGCESSGTVREAFRRRGHDAWSCDLQAADDGSAFHIQGDVRDAVTAQRWDMFIVHPTCTYLCVSGLHWNKRGRMVDGRPRAELTEEAIAFAVSMMCVDVPRIAMENPVGCLSTRYRKPDQIIQPYQYGDDASKGTCLWLKGLRPLRPTGFCEPRLVCDDCRTVFTYGQHRCPGCGGESYKPRWANQTDSGQNRLAPSTDRWKLRSVTYQGIADAMAEQWGKG